MKYEELGKGVIKRTERRVLGLFIDGTGLDRATRRLNRKVDMSALVRGVSSGLTPIVARYYTLIPYEDDSRQRAFLDAVSRAGLSVIVKRLPPKGVTRQVSIDVEMASDLVAFALGHSQFSDLCEYKLDDQPAHPAKAQAAVLPLGKMQRGQGPAHNEALSDAAGRAPSAAAAVPHQSGAKLESVPVELTKRKELRMATVVCPGRDLAYAIALAGELHVETTTADFGQFNSHDILKSAAKWMDLSDSETIWRG